MDLTGVRVSVNFAFLFYFPWVRASMCTLFDTLLHLRFFARLFFFFRVRTQSKVEISLSTLYAYFFSLGVSKCHYCLLLSNCGCSSRCPPLGALFPGRGSPCLAPQTLPKSVSAVLPSCRDSCMWCNSCFFEMSVAKRQVRSRKYI